MASRSNSRGRPPSRRAIENLEAPTGNTAPVVLTHEQFMELLEAARRAPEPPANTAVGGAAAADNDDVQFALSPALVNMMQPIDFSTSEGTKLNKTIPVGGETRNLIEDYGNISIDQIRVHCQGYVLNRTRQAQH